jgi:signal transduction histidine kinase
MTLGADDYLLKPITQSELLLAVERRLTKHSAIREQTERRMDALRANISLALPHELRTPLHGILGFCGLLQNDYASLSAEDVKDLAGRIKRAADRLQRLVENFLIFAQLEVVASDDRQIGELRAAESPDVVRLVEIVGRQRAAHYRRPGDFAVIGTASNASIEESSLTRLVDELLDNAFKFSNSGSPVTVTVEPAGTFCQLTINDHGRGMAPEQVDALGAYMQFNRRVQEQQGSGLGFVIARRLIELHGGTVQVESKEQEGTTVRISLPRPSPPTT